MTDKLSLSLEAVPHLPDLSDSCSIVEGLKTSAIPEIVGTTFSLIVDAFTREDLLTFYDSHLAKISLASALIIPFKWYKDCSAKSISDQKLVELVAKELKINQASLECSTASKACYIEEAARKIIPKNIKVADEIESSSDNPKEISLEKTAIAIRQVDNFPEKKTTAFLTQNLVTGFGVGFFSVGILATTAATAAVGLTVLTTPLILATSVLAYGTIGHIVIRSFISPVTTLMIKTGILGSAAALAYNGQNLLKVHRTNKELSKRLSEKTAIPLEAIQCDGIHKICYITEASKEKKMEIIGPLTRKVDEAGALFKNFEHHSIKQEIQAALKHTVHLADHFQKSLTKVTKFVESLLEKWL